ncbi:MAG: glycosyltransferase [Actinobacteria bacterium]|nr:glycosyltransferase [Actinomycetota bacterium]
MFKLSVLIPTYRPGGYLFNCLESIENQTLNKNLFKVYIGLNGERAPYYQFIQDTLNGFSFDYELIYIEPTGVSNARNALIEISTEDFIVFIDDDDVVSPSYLEELLKVSSKDVMGIANIYNFENTTEEKKPNYIGRTFQTIVDGESSKFKVRKYFSSPWAKMIHREMIGPHRFDIKVAKGEDSLFMALLSPNVKSVKKTCDDACYFVHERVGSVTRRKTLLHSEIKTLNYLTLQYLHFLFTPQYDLPFIATRLAATAFKYLKLIKR